MRTSGLHIKNILWTSQEICKSGEHADYPERNCTHTGQDTGDRQLVPITYSFRNPLLLPLRADLMICGNHIKEYVTDTKTIDKVGDRITRTMKVKKMKSVTPNIVISPGFSSW